MVANGGETMQLLQKRGRGLECRKKWAMRESLLELVAREGRASLACLCRRGSHHANHNTRVG